tara:strand:- start:288 stop:1568 length:1281 start_codon:yes stop_codon:yes gene_type:complete
MNILLLEGAYSSFHQNLAVELGDEVYCFLFDIGYSVFNYKIKMIPIKRYLSSVALTAHDVEYVSDVTSLQSVYYQKTLAQELPKDFIEVCARYSVLLKSFLIENSISLVLMHNDMRWQHAVAIKVLNELNIPYFVTERGMVRPYTTTLDFIGVNANSNVARFPEDYSYYDDISVEDYRLLPKSSRIATYTRFGLFVLLSKVGDFLRFNVGYRHKHFSFLSYIKIFLNENVGSKFNRTQQHEKLPDSYVYFPLQVSGDSQILVHSDFSSMQEAIACVEREFYAANLDDVKLVINLHPMEPDSSYVFDPRTVISKAPTHTLINECKSVITINSTVGVEALRQGKLVYLLGRAYFADSDYMYITPRGDQLSVKLVEYFKYDSSPGKLNNCSEFIKDVSMRNQILGDVYQYDNSVIKNAARIIRCRLNSI